MPVPSQEPVIQWLSLFNCLLLFFRCFNRVGRLFINCDTFCIFRGLLQLALRYGFRSIVEGRNVTSISLNLSVVVGGCLMDNHATSSYLYISSLTKKPLLLDVDSMVVKLTTRGFHT